MSISEGIAVQRDMGYWVSVADRECGVVTIAVEGVAAHQRDSEVVPIVAVHVDSDGHHEVVAVVVVADTYIQQLPFTWAFQRERARYADDVSARLVEDTAIVGRVELVETYSPGSDLARAGKVVAQAKGIEAMPIPDLVDIILMLPCLVRHVWKLLWLITHRLFYPLVYNTNTQQRNV
jgi:hypothetical protein